MNLRCIKSMLIQDSIFFEEGEYYPCIAYEYRVISVSSIIAPHYCFSWNVEDSTKYLPAARSYFAEEDLAMLYIRGEFGEL